MSGNIFRRGNKKELFHSEGLSEPVEGGDSGDLEAKLSELAKFWSAPRSKKDVSVAVWKPSERVAEVAVQRGKVISSVGFMRTKKLYLHLEEAVYLIDRSDLLLVVEEGRNQQRLLSLQEAYDLMVMTGVSMTQFLVYCDLMRTGYIARRYPARWIVDRHEDPASVWHGPVWADAAQHQAIDAPHAAAPSTPAGNAQDEAATAAPVPLPAISQCHRLKRHKGSMTAAAQQRPWWLMDPERCVWPRLSDGELQSLPRCLVDDEAQRLQAARSRLIPFACAAFPAQQVAGPETLPLAFEVFKINPKFSRKAPDKPICRVCITHDRAPAWESMRSAQAVSAGVEVKFAWVSQGNVDYFGFPSHSLEALI